MRFLLIPVGNSGNIQREVVVVAVLNAESERLVEVDGICDVESVHVCAAQTTDVVVHARIAVVGVAEQRVRAPRCIEVILGSGTKRGWHFFSINEELFISFTPPVIIAYSHVIKIVYL